MKKNLYLLVVLFFSFCNVWGTSWPVTDTIGDCLFSLANNGDLRIYKKAQDGRMADMGINMALHHTILQYDTVAETQIKKVIIEDSVKRISSGSFMNFKGLQTITIGKHVESIASDWISNCTNLTSFIITENNQRYSVDAAGVLYNRNKTALIRVPSGLTGDFAVPEGVTAIAPYAFAWCTKINAVTGMTGVDTIYSGVFSNCDTLKSVTLPDGIKFIGDRAFYGCKNLTRVILPNNPNFISISNSLFSECARLNNIEIPPSVTAIGEMAFSGCVALPEVTLPASVQNIGDRAFNNCAVLTTIFNYASNPQPININVFEGCNMTKDFFKIWVKNADKQKYVDANTWKTLAIVPMDLAVLNYFGDPAYNGKIKPIFASNIYKYFLSLPYEIDKIHLIVHCDIPYDFEGGDKSLEVGKNTFTYTIRSKDGSQQNTYTLDVIRNIENGIVERSAIPLRVYPNPTYGDLTIDGEDLLAYNGRVKAYDTRGALLGVYDISGASATIDISALPAGTYLLKAGERTAKVVRMRQ